MSLPAPSAAANAAAANAAAAACSSVHALEDSDAVPVAAAGRRQPQQLLASAPPHSESSHPLFCAALLRPRTRNASCSPLLLLLLLLLLLGAQCRLQRKKQDILLIALADEVFRHRPRPRKQVAQRLSTRPPKLQQQPRAPPLPLQGRRQISRADST